MKRYLFAAAAVACCVFCLVIGAGGQLPAVDPTGTPPPAKPRVGVTRMVFPRTDLSVQFGDVNVEPAFGFISWFAFQKKGNDSGVIMRGELVLRPAEIQPVVDKLLAADIEVMGLHNHMLGESPRIMYMNIGGEGDPAKLNRAVRDAIALTGTPLNPGPLAPSKALPGAWSDIENTLGASGVPTGDIELFFMPRLSPVTDQDLILAPEMGVAHDIRFQRIGLRMLAVGELVLTAPEINPVCAQLQKAGIRVTSVHNQMLTESPRLYFVSYVGVGDGPTMAQGIRAALDKTDTANPMKGGR